MYLPSHFNQPDLAYQLTFMQAHPFATLVLPGSNGLVANSLPIWVEEREGELKLLAHIAKANSLWSEVEPGAQGVVIFQGEEHYVSPGWYPSKKTSQGKVVPTWNYSSVHAHGTVRFIEDKLWLMELLQRLTQRYESTRAEPWAMSDAPSDYIERMLSAIVGLEFTVTRVEAKAKLSQNRPNEDQTGVAQGLREEGSDAASRMAALIDQNLAAKRDCAEVK